MQSLEKQMLVLLLQKTKSTHLKAALADYLATISANLGAIETDIDMLLISPEDFRTVLDKINASSNSACAKCLS